MATSEVDFLSEQIERCRRLAKTTFDKHASRILDEMADEFEARLRQIDPPRP